MKPKSHGGTRPRSGPKTKQSRGERKYIRFFVLMSHELFDLLDKKRGESDMAPYIRSLIKKGGLKPTERGPRDLTGPKTRRVLVTMPPEFYDSLQKKRGLAPLAPYIRSLIEAGLEVD